MPASPTKRTRPAEPWLWVIGGLLILAAALVPFLGHRGPPRRESGGEIEVAVGEPAAIDDALVPAAVVDFTRYVRGVPWVAGPDSIRLQTATALAKLADAIDAVAVAESSRGAAPVAHTEEVRRRAGLLRAGTDPTRDAYQAHEAFGAAAAALGALQRGYFPGFQLAVGRAAGAAGMLRMDAPLAEQSPAVQEFFARASTVLHGMATRDRPPRG